MPTSACLENKKNVFISLVYNQHKVHEKYKYYGTIIHKLGISVFILLKGAATDMRYFANLQTKFVNKS